MLLRAFEALREHIPATLTLVGAQRGGGRAHDARGLGRDARSARSPRRRSCAELREADVLCAPVAERRELRHGADRGLRGRHAGRRLGHPRLPRRRARRRGRRADAARATRSRSAEALRALALDRSARASAWRAHARERAERFAWPHVAAEVLDVLRAGVATAVAHAAASRVGRVARRYGLAPADLLPRDPRASGCRACSRPGPRRRRARGGAPAADAAPRRAARELRVAGGALGASRCSRSE